MEVYLGKGDYLYTLAVHLVKEKTMTDELFWIASQARNDGTQFEMTVSSNRSKKHPG